MGFCEPADYREDLNVFVIYDLKVESEYVAGWSPPFSHLPDK